jgi:predicted phosphodiesterase
MTAGLGVYKWQIFDLLNISFPDQLRHVAENHPKLKNGKKTFAINGNHDAAWNDIAGMNFWEELQKLRPDIVNVGSYQWNIILNDIKIWLQHWSKGLPYAVSYHLQKYIEKLPQGKEPDIYVLWHYHSALMLDYHGIICFLPWAFQRWNLLTKRMWLPEDNIGGWIVEIIKEWNKIHINPKYYRF